MIRLESCHDVMVPNYYVTIKNFPKLSTPFMNLSLILEMSNVEKNSIYYLNGHLFYWTFLITRPTMIPFYWLKVSHHLAEIDSLLNSISLSHLVFNIIMSIVLDVLNIIWTVFISKDYHRRISERRKQLENGLKSE